MKRISSDSRLVLITLLSALVVVLVYHFVIKLVPASSPSMLRCDRRPPRYYAKATEEELHLLRSEVDIKREMVKWSDAASATGSIGSIDQINAKYELYAALLKLMRRQAAVPGKRTNFGACEAELDVELAAEELRDEEFRLQCGSGSSYLQVLAAKNALNQAEQRLLAFKTVTGSPAFREALTEWKQKKTEEALNKLFNAELMCYNKECK